MVLTVAGLVVNLDSYFYRQLKRRKKKFLIMKYLMYTRLRISWFKLQINYLMHAKVLLSDRDVVGPVSSYWDRIMISEYSFTN